MSLGVWLDCDECGDTITAGPVGTGAVIRAEARALGWHVGLKGGKDVCPECWAMGYRPASTTGSDHP